MSRAGVIALILGLVGGFLGGGVVVVSFLLPVLTNGRTSWEEALFGIIPGVLLLCLSFVVAVAGAVLIFLKKRKARTAP